MLKKYEIPWLSIWVNPRDTVHWILNNQKNPVLLILLLGLAMNLDNAYVNSSGDTLSLSAILLIAIILCPVTGYLFVWISTYLFSITGQWLGGTGSTKEIKPVVAWSGIFYVASLVIRFLEILLLGNELFQTVQPTVENNTFLSILFIFFHLLELAIFIWWAVFLAVALGEVHSFSKLRGFFTMLVSLLLVVLFNILIILILMIF
ncbi:MAG: YIP1 family protein [Thermoactinomyces sp.]